MDILEGDYVLILDNHCSRQMYRGHLEYPCGGANCIHWIGKVLSIQGSIPDRCVSVFAPNGNICGYPREKLKRRKLSSSDNNRLAFASLAGETLKGWWDGEVE